ncbi:hypothetical protein OEA41_002544 [Lepraria neglecta]|uniref:Uncharacterized protein n=1 Tax=Lepraria neglecta TaxID=209136 RepID=A0AAD9ZEH4_9LECA|nr:hypothetical protein OEA41_002544 [Lepraria neglecta]
MPRQGSPSPHRRPQLTERQSSTQSLSKGSPTAGHLSKSHKGSSTRLYKAYAVGHGRHPHARVPSYGKGLHKLSKLGPGEPGDGGGQANHNKSGSSTPTGSPTSQKFKRNSSNVSLPRTGSKVSMKKNASNVSLTRDVSATRLGNQQKSEKAQTKNDLRKNGTDDRPLKGQASFEVGDEEEQDEDWTEDNSSQSPNTTRQSSARPKSPLSRDPPSPDEETPDRSPQNLPHSPPQSPPTNPSAFTNHTKENDHPNGSPYSHPPNAEDVTHRLLNRSTHNAAPTTSNILAIITPSGSTGSPPSAHSHTSTIAPEPSMPANGISRFLTSTGSSSGSATPGSVSQLQSTLAHLNHGPTSPPRRDTTPNAQTSSRVKSAANLFRPRINGESGSVSPPKQQRKPSYNLPEKVANPWAPRISPYESARAADPSAGKSLTQLRLDLQRMSSQREVTPAQQPLMQHGSVIGIQNLSAGSSEMAARLERQYQQAQLEYRNGRRFYPELLVGNISRSKDGKIGDGSKKQKTKTPVGSGSSGERRGRVRFEVGASPGKDLGNEEGSVEGDGEGVEGLLRRMWVGSEGVSGEE